MAVGVRLPVRAVAVFFVFGQSPTITSLKILPPSKRAVRFIGGATHEAFGSLRLAPYAVFNTRRFLYPHESENGTPLHAPPQTNLMVIICLP